MSDTPATDQNSREPTREEMMSALFAQLVLQQSNMAMMLLGKTPHPQSGETLRDTEAARMFIDQLEMLEIKTKGNLSREEESLLKRSLMALRLAFVEAVETPAPAGPAPTSAKPPPSATPGAPAEHKAAPASEASDSESKKKFSKKY